MRSARRLVMALIILVGTHAADLSAQMFGPELVWGEDSDLGVGARAELDIGQAVASSGPLSRAILTGAFDFFFPDCDTGATGTDCSATYWELRGDVVVPISAASFDPYAGAGLHLAYASVDFDSGGFGVDSSDNELGFDLVGGLRFTVGDLPAFTELRLELGGGDQLELAFGVLFGQR